MLGRRGRAWAPLAIAAVGALLVAGSTLAQQASCPSETSGACAPILWQRVALPSGEVAGLAFSPADPNVVYAGFDANAHAFYRSTDAGKTWSRLAGPYDHTKGVAASPSDPQIGYAVMPESIYTTDLSVEPTRRSSQDRPDARTQTQSIFGLQRNNPMVDLVAVAVAPANADVLYAAVGGGSLGPAGDAPAILFGSTDRGVTWNRGDPALTTIGSIAVDPRDSARLLVGAQDGVYETRDLGATLVRLAATSDLVRSIDASPDGSSWYAATLARLLRSTDGGVSWADAT
ncbi:MAG TPA: hypothetical protein VM681_02605, partial [Candidatus Thermoplasmatota archaeon]|nr:hypothetical protein [Candidatus Thermoplasmatota archaeon]